LPTEAEWEYACRAGAVTSRYYGQSEELLGKYDWYLKNSGDRTWPVGSLKPNDFGLFDMHGNVWAWCHDSYRLYEAGQKGKAAEDSEDNSVVTDATSRVLRGGGFLDQPRYLRSAYRNWDLPGTQSNALGFRPARTYN
jgi:formylglycine-generating enzyme required for sulfatase activity